MLHERVGHPLASRIHHLLTHLPNGHGNKRLHSQTESPAASEAEPAWKRRAALLPTTPVVAFTMGGGTVMMEDGEEKEDVYWSFFGTSASTSGKNGVGVSSSEPNSPSPLSIQPSWSKDLGKCVDSSPLVVHWQDSKVEPWYGRLFIHH
mgnify:FL=1